MTSWTLVNIGSGNGLVPSGNGLVPDSTKPSPGAVLSYNNSRVLCHSPKGNNPRNAHGSINMGLRPMQLNFQCLCYWEIVARADPGFGTWKLGVAQYISKTIYTPFYTIFYILSPLLIQCCNIKSALVWVRVITPRRVALLGVITRTHTRADFLLIVSRTRQIW